MKFNPAKARRAERRAYFKEERRRVLTVRWELAEGKPTEEVVEGLEKRLQARCDELGIWNMTDEEFEAYRLGVLERFPLPAGMRVG